MEESILFSSERDDTVGGDHDLLQLVSVSSLLVNMFVS